MSVAAILARGRRRTATRMTSGCDIRRLSGTKTTNAQGFEVDGWTAVHTNIPFRLGGAERGGSGYRVVKIGDTEIQVAVRVAHLSASTTGLRDNDVVNVISGESAGLFLQIAEASWADQQTALRVPVFEIAEPEGWS